MFDDQNNNNNRYIDEDYSDDDEGEHDDADENEFDENDEVDDFPINGTRFDPQHLIQVGTSTQAEIHHIWISASISKHLIQGQDSPHHNIY